MFSYRCKVNRKTAAQYSRQGGAMLVMFTIGLFSLLAVAALALDGGHLLLSKGRLQNAVDASALQAAKKLQEGGSLFEAREVATQLLMQNLQFSENSELDSSIDLSTPDYNATQVTTNLFIEFSEWPDPFNPILTEGSLYTRVRVENVGLDNFLAQILNFDKAVRASAVAGKSTDIECVNKVLPMMVCGVYEEPNFPELIDETMPFGLPVNELYVMKVGSKQGNAIGPGNFQLLRLDGNNGAADLRRALAGEFTPGACISAGDDVPTEPGNSTGPVAQGLNTRLGEWKGGGTSSDEYPRDYDTCQGDRVLVNDDGEIVVQLDEFDVPVLDDDGHPIPANNAGNALDYYSYDQYRPEAPSPPPSSCPAGFSGDVSTDDSISAGGRRELPVVIGICDGMTNGANTITSLGTGCFFLTQNVEQKGNDAYVVGEFVSECASSGNASFNPSFVSNTSTIVLYRDPDSPDS